MNITIVTGPFNPLPPATCGAVERRWHDLSAEFIKKGHRVTFLCRSHCNQPRNETKDGIRYIRRTQLSRGKSIYWNLAKDFVYSIRMLMLLPKSDILVTNSFWTPVLAANLRHDVGKIVVNVARVPKGQMGFYHQAARLSVPSRPVLDEIIAQCPKVAPLIKVIPNPVDTLVFKPPKAPRVLEGKKEILYAGRVHPEKGLHLLIDAFAQLRQSIEDPPLRLKIVGPSQIDQGGGGDRYLRVLSAKTKGLPVDFSEPIFNKEKLAEVYQSADLFCYPSLAEKGESFGVAALEAMATGLVPVVSDLACFRDFIEDGITGIFFDHRSPRAVAILSEALRKLIKDRKMTLDMGAKATARAAQFSNQNIAELYLTDFEELLGRAH